MSEEHCSVCGNEIRQMIFRGSGFCGEACRKKKDAARTILEAEAELIEFDTQEAACNFCGRTLLSINLGPWNHATTRAGDTPHEPQPIPNTVRVRSAMR